jgi:hypothetical protein
MTVWMYVYRSVRVCLCVRMYVRRYVHAYILVYKYEFLLEPDTFSFLNTSLQKIPFSYFQRAIYLIANPN